MPEDSSRDLLNAALRLSIEERAALVTALIDSLHTDVGVDVEAAWSAEIEHRLRELESGQVKTIPWTLVRPAGPRENPACE